MGAKHCGRSWEKNSCSFLNKTGKETRGVLRFGAGLLEYLFSSNVGFYKRQKNKREEQREREKGRGQGRTAQKQRGEKAATKRQET
jgi:hypothetical protein